MKKFMVHVISLDGEKVVKEMGPFQENKAEKVDAGININLNHEEYYTLVVPVDESGTVKP